MPSRAIVLYGVLPVLAASVVADGHRPLTPELVTAAGPAAVLAQHPGAAQPLLPTVHLPRPHAVRQPASVSAVADSTTAITSMPPVALSAYQSAATTVDAADPACHLDWTLLGAIGQVESDNGQAGGSHLNRHGVDTPPIIGVRLDGRHGVGRVADTDNGRLDGDRRFDHAVGPMQFLPSTWAAVAVDADGDGRRDVQDINDAALGAAVYLCAGNGDLSTPSGLRQAVLRYNHSHVYLTTVLAVARELRHGDFFEAGASPTLTTFRIRHRHHHHRAHPTRGTHHTTHTTTPTSPSSSPSSPSSSPSSPSSSPSTTPTATPTGSPSASPTDSPTGSPTNSPTDSPTGSPTDSPTDTPTSAPTASASQAPSSAPTSSTAAQPVLPDPLPAALAGLTRHQVAAYDAAWPGCRQALTRGTTALARCLAAATDTGSHDPQLLEVVHWLARHEAVATG